MSYLEQYFSLQNKVALVTGGNRGIGRAIAVSLAKAGADVCIVASSQNGLQETEDLIKATGQKAFILQQDLSQKANCVQVVQDCHKHFGRIDILVNNAGIIRRAPIIEGTDSDWDAVMSINIDASYVLSREVAKLMVSQKSGKIVNIASLLSFQGGKFVPAYTASKHAVAGLTKAFANELAAYNINVNAIAPGYINTDNTKALREDPVRFQEILSRIPAERWGEPEDIANTAVFLASQAAGYMHGHILAVDGGWLAR